MTTRPGDPEFYEDEEGGVRWRVRAANGEIVDAASEGFSNLRKAWDNYTIGLRNKAVTFESAEEQFNEGSTTGGAQGEATISSPDTQGAGGTETGGSSTSDPDSGLGDETPEGTYSSQE